MPKKTTVYTMTFLLIILLLISTFKIQTANAITTVYIKPDGTIDQPSNLISTSDNITYTLTSSANIAIVIQRSNIILDGKGYTINGTGIETGFNLNNVANVTIKNVKIQNFYYGILLSNSSNNNINKNTITKCYYGIYLNTSSNYNTIAENTVKNNNYGAYINASLNINLTNNTITTNRYHGILLNNTSNNIITNNTITSNNHGIEFTDSINNNINRNTITSNYGTGILTTRFQNNSISENTIKLNSNGIEFTDSSNNNITENIITANNEAGILLTRSAYNNINQNNVTNNNYGIYIYISSDNSITQNNITYNNYYGIIVDSSSNNIMASNNLTANKGGIKITSSSNNTLQNNTMYNNNYNFELWGVTLTQFLHNIDTSNNINGKPIYYMINRQDEEIPANAAYVGLVNCSRITIQNLNLTNNGQGIMLAYTTNTTIKENIVANNYYGIRTRESSNNYIYHNAFINNTIQASLYNSTNFWDDGYPSGGNYWSDYTETDLFRGTYQNETNSDGIGDKAYVIDANNKDNYPLMKIYGGPFDIGITNVTKSEAVVPNGYIININVTVINYSIETETFNLTAYANSTIIAQLLNVNLESRNSATITITWNTLGFVKGNYTISATASLVQNEKDAKDNTFINGNIFILSPEHDVAITKIKSIPAIGQGYTLPINIEVMNVGNYTETFNINLHVNSTLIASQTITLESGICGTVNFTWNTTGYERGNYIISAYAEPVLNEADLSDNERVSWLTIAKVGDFGSPVNNVPTFFVCDGKVDGWDLALFIYCYKGLAPPENICLTDLGSGPPPTFFACDGKINAYDLALFIQCYKGLGP